MKVNIKNELYKIDEFRIKVKELSLRKRDERNKISNKKNKNIKPKKRFYKDYNKYLKTKKWNKISNKIKKRDKLCKKCFSSKNLNVHHLTYKHIFNEENHLKDLILLCNECHNKIHQEENYLNCKL